MKNRFLTFLKYILSIIIIICFFELTFYMSSSMLQKDKKHVSGLILSYIPDRLEKSYIDYILDERAGYLRSSFRKCRMIDIIFYARRSDIYLRYDNKILENYTGEYMSKKLGDLCLDEPAAFRARWILENSNSSKVSYL
jgi:type I restriction-modification system DNA methylase subunit